MDSKNQKYHKFDSRGLTIFNIHKSDKGITPCSLNNCMLCPNIILQEHLSGQNAPLVGATALEMTSQHTDEKTQNTQPSCTSKSKLH